MELSKLKKILEDDYGWGNLDTDENRWFVDEILQDSIYAISEALTLTSVVGQSEQLCDEKNYGKVKAIHRFENGKWVEYKID